MGVGLCGLGLPPCLGWGLVGCFAPELACLSLQPEEVAGDVFSLKNEVYKVGDDPDQRNQDREKGGDVQDTGTIGICPSKNKEGDVL